MTEEIQRLLPVIPNAVIPVYDQPGSQLSGGDPRGAKKHFRR